MSNTISKKPEPQNRVPQEHFADAISHINSALSVNQISHSAAKGLVYSLVETLGSMIGDPDLPSHIRSGYEGVLELAQELERKIQSIG